MHRGWGTRFLAFILAILLWFYAKTQRTYNIEIPILVEYKGLSDELAFVEPPDSAIMAELTVKGTGLLGMVFLKPRLVIDLSRVRLGRNTITISPSALDTRGLNIGIRGFRPQELEFVLDTVARKRPAVIPQIKGEPEKGFVVSGLRATGSPVVEGPGALIMQTREIYTEPVNIAGRRSGFKAMAKLISPFPSARISPQEIEVEVIIEPLSTKTLMVPVVIEGKRGWLSSDSVNITIEGPASLVSAFSGIRGKIMADTLMPGTYRLTPEIRLPKDIRLVKMEPEELEVRVR